MGKLAWYGEEILTDYGEQSIRKYQYKGGDASYIYKYITGKLAQYVVDYVYPAWLAYIYALRTQPKHSIVYSN